MFNYLGTSYRKDMIVFTLYFILFLTKLCYCGNAEVTVPSVNTTFDLSSPDPSLVRDYESTINGVVYRSFFPKGLLFSKVIDGEVTLWEGKGEERCISVEYITKETSTLISIGINTGDGYTDNYFEKLDGKWSGLTTETFKEKFNKVTGRSQRTIPVTLDLSNPSESNICTKNYSYNGIMFNNFSPNEGYHIGYIVDGKAPVWIGEEETRCISTGYSTKGDFSLLTVEVDNSVSIQAKYFERVGSEWKSITGYEFKEKISAMIGRFVEYSGNDQSLASPENSHPEETVETPAGTDEVHSETPLHPVNGLADDNADVPPFESSKDPREVTSPPSQQNEGPKVPVEPTIEQNEPKEEAPKESKVEDAKAVVETPVEEAKPEVAPAESNENGSESGDVDESPKENEPTLTPTKEPKKRLKGRYPKDIAEQESPELEELNPVPDFKSKVDSTLFDVEEGEEDGVPVLELKAKPRVTVTRFSYDGKKIWSGVGRFSTFFCSSSTLYFDGDKPVLSVVISKDKSCRFEATYRYLDGKHWRNCTLRNHNRKLKVLKNKCKPEDASPGVIDVNSPDGSLCKMFKCIMDGVETLLCVPSFGLREINSGSLRIWKADKYCDICTLLKIHHKDGQPVLIHFTVECGSKLSGYALLKCGKLWKNIDNYDTEVKRFVAGTNSIRGFVLDLTDVEESEECKVFKANQFGVYITIFVPTPGFYTTRITYGECLIYVCCQENCEHAKIVKMHEFGSMTLINFVISDLNGAREYYYVKDGATIYITEANKKVNLIFYKHPTKVSRISKPEDERAVTRHYFIPIYYITFPGYKRKCSRTYRFWVKEKDLIKLHSVKWPTRRSKHPDVNLCTSKSEIKADPVWCKRDVQSINEYVYKIRSNLYNRYIVSGRCSGGQGYSGLAYLPWLIPKKLTEIVYAQYKRVSEVRNISNSFLPIEKHFNTSSLLPRLSTRSLVQNFKYTVLVIAKLLRNTQDADFDVRGEKEDGDDDTYEEDPEVEDDDVEQDEEEEDEEADGEVDEMFVPSLRFMEHLESALDGSLTYNYFFEAFVNNLYWVDVFVYWMDTNFTTKCCFTDTECRLIKHLGENKGAPYSAFLGLEYFCRLFCFDTLYISLLERIERRAGQCLTYLPITQLLIQYLTFVASDYSKTQEYGLDD
ncbi:hypothetical protein BEWA_027300 [Theileria equi strain WA]|uniref:Signal peptide containing protein n=1 Tax=Theileria equi strain WA TaxID=1537102 RepID=L0AY12_THEEQ|nr:hypothetical protein BEWA_027300 [Theileria equi strain WA]AFZ79881.1 hypothetical protein BEWA_027300 [Theileria equi strain WA]|eukprot:XP_004829547.1 hypothetical protein BEWA_027300 [Theileria equi strain WA]